MLGMMKSKISFNKLKKDKIINNNNKKKRRGSVYVIVMRRKECVKKSLFVNVT